MNPIPLLNAIGTFPIAVDAVLRIVMVLAIVLPTLVWVVTLSDARRLLRGPDTLTVDPRPGGRRFSSACPTVRFGPFELPDSGQSR